MGSDHAASPEQRAFVFDLARRYLWWAPAGDAPHAFERALAQIMNLGTYEDIRRLEAELDENTLLGVMMRAEPGWFDARSWAFWRGRLAASRLPERPPRRRFADAADA